MSVPRDLPPRMQVHYCRECPKKFSGNNIQRHPTPHSQVWSHRLRIHGFPFSEYVSCSRNCEYREQPEEAHLGQRLYGKGVPQARPVETGASYATLFPKEEGLED